MAEEMIEDFTGESDEALDTESDEAIAEAEDSTEAVSDRSRWRRQQRGSYRPLQRGVGGITLRNQQGLARTVPFPTKLATVSETNRSLATQEIARRALDVRLDRLEARFRVQQKRDSATSGLVSLAIGVPLVAIGVFQTSNDKGGATLSGWADKEATRIAAVTSATQLATSGAKLVINGRYHRSGIGIAADIFATAQIATFAFGFFNKKAEEEYKAVADKGVADAALAGSPKGTLFLAQDTGNVYRVEMGVGNVPALRLLAAKA
jgi:hypothetical protein